MCVDESALILNRWRFHLEAFVCLSLNLSVQAFLSSRMRLYVRMRKIRIRKFHKISVSFYCFSDKKKEKIRHFHLLFLVFSLFFFFTGLHFLFISFVYSLSYISFYHVCRHSFFYLWVSTVHFLLFLAVQVCFYLI